MHQTNTIKNISTKYPNTDYKLLNELNINFNSVNFTHDIDKFENIQYKFGNPNYYPDWSNWDIDVETSDSFDWEMNLRYLIENILDDGVTYSIAVLGSVHSHGRFHSITFGEHLLVTNKIDIEELIMYLYGQIDSSQLSLQYGHLLEDTDDQFSIQFKYREITISKEVFDLVSKIKHSEKLKIEDTTTKDLAKIHNDKKILKFLNTIPLTSDFTKFGEMINANHITRDGKFGILFSYGEDIEIFIYDHKNNKYNGIIYKKGYEYCKFTDIVIWNNPDYDLIRIFGSKSVFLKDGSIVHMEILIKSKLIKQEKREIIHNTKYLTFDIECYLENKNNNTNKNKTYDNKQLDFIPYACGWYSKDNYKIYISTEFNSWQEMISQFLTDIEQKYKDYTIYIHNFSSFDSLYMLKTLYKKYKTSALFKDGKPISVNVSKKIKKGLNFKLFIKDSLKLLPLSLEKLIKSFSIDTKKLPFPYRFVTKDRVDYVGPIPTFDYFIDNGLYDPVKHGKYLELSKEFENKPWNLIEETKKYLYNDIKSLFEIIEKFSKDVYEVESINVTNIVSISSLALKTFLTNYYDEDRTPIKIPRLKQYSNIRQAYYGGRVEVFSSYVENAHWYDVNSLYPTVMLQDMPIGDIIKSTDPNLDNYFGFCYATVNVPNNTYNPVLPFRDDKWNIYNPTGKWTGWYSSEILKYARDNQNVIVIVHYGYKYETGKDVFTKYINYFFNLKREADKMKDDVKRILAKLKLNSLYGRFGLKYTKINTEIVTSDRAKELTLKYNILDNVKLDEENNLEFIRYNVEPSDYLFYKDENLYHEINAIGQKESDNIIRSVGISSMITSYAMMLMNPFLNLPDNKCYYTETDSTFLQKPLDPKYVGDELGQFKYEGLVRRAYFISPKLYCLILEDGKIIIKSKGVPSKYLTELDFIELLNGIYQSVLHITSY